jgi:HAD superfamily hydrolase (TIGR01509 family)
VTPALEAVVFDLDGVLVDSGIHHRAAWRALLDEIGERGADEFWRLTIGRPSTEAVPLLLGRPVPWHEADRLARRKHEHYVRFARRGLLPVAGVPRFVELLGAHGIARAVATSASRRDAERILEALALRHHFGAVVAAEDVRRGKPDPEVYLRAARGIGADPSRCLAFEDAVVGVQAARAAGLTVIGVTTAHSEAELRAAGAARAVTDFEELSWPT